MPGPKMGPRPRDFDAELVRRSPTFLKWENLSPGGKLRYACREFVKGQGDDEERLMRRIMIARRNNVRDHQALKWARRMQTSVLAKETKTDPSPSQNHPKEFVASSIKAEPDKEMEIGAASNNSNNCRVRSSRSETEAIISRTTHMLQGAQDSPPGRRSRRPTTLISDEAIKEEMDVHAVEATRSYKSWLALPNGAVFLYNQKYIKGQECHDWLLKKNIWRRMRYRRENKKMVEQMLSRERTQSPVQHQSRKRRHETSSSVTTITAAIGSNNRNPLDRIMVDPSARAMAVNPAVAASTTSMGQPPPTGTRNESNRQEAVASTASEIVDHALLSTNTGVVVPSPAIAPTTGNAITISIGDPRQQQQQIQDHPSSALPHHHHDAAGSATAFAASIALAGVGIGTDGDLNAHHDTAVADSAAVEAAVVAALAATDAKSNSYHHHMSHPALDSELVEVNRSVHGSNGPLETTEPPEDSEAVPGLGLALDAAAKLAAAAVTYDSDAVAVLAATKVIAAAAVIKEEGESDQVDEGTIEV